MTSTLSLRRDGPVLLHLLTGVLVVVFTLRAPCGPDECLGPLAAGASAWVWTAALPFVVVAARAEGRQPRALAWCVWLLCIPLSWAFTLGLFLMYPGLAGA